MSFEARKSEVLIHLTDSNGNPIANTSLNAKLSKHEFLFGCGAFDFIPRANMNPVVPIFEDRADKWLRLYNYGTLPFYWGGYEPTEGNPNCDQLMNAAKFMTGNNVTVKGHPLCWHTVCADWLMKYDNKTILDKQLARINREVTAFRGVIDMWDVINEVVIMPVFDKYDNAITRICKEYGRVNLVKEVFDAAKAANPDAVFLINDFNLSDKYASLISDCLDAGVKFGAIGLQTHQHQGYMGLEKLSEILRRFEKFGIPLHFTENTLVSGHIMPADIVDLNDYQIPEWPTTPEGEERQAKEIKEMYSFLFEHPLVEAVTGWDFADGAWLGAPSGVIRKDGSVKPSYTLLRELIHNEWTTECELRTDENGNARLYGFRGTYDITCGDKKTVLRLGKDTASCSITL